MTGKVIAVMPALFSLNGRMRRRDYWIYSLVIWVIVIAINYASFLLWGPGGSYFKAFAIAKTHPFNGYVITVYAMIVVSAILRFNVAAKRWHDRNRSAWISALVTVVWYTAYATKLFFPATFTGNPLLSNLVGLPMLAVGLWTFIECGCLDGRPEANRYGPSPKGISDPANLF